MKTLRIALICAPILVLTHSAFAQADDPNEDAPLPPPVSTTQTTAAFQPIETAEPRPAPKNPVSNRGSIEPMIGYGTAGFNTGVGGRIGYTFDIPIYLGGTFMWHTGETDTTSNTVNVETSRKRNLWYPGVEAGYDVGNKSFMVRPYVGAAILYDRDRVTVGNSTTVATENQFMMYPGLTAHYNVAESPLFIGADTRLVVPVEHGPASYQAFFVTGLSP